MISRGMLLFQKIFHIDNFVILPEVSHRSPKNLFGMMIEDYI